MANYKRNRSRGYERPPENDEIELITSDGWLESKAFKTFSEQVQRAVKASSTPMSLADIRKAMGDSYDARKIFDAIESLPNIKDVGITMSRYIYEEPRIAPRIEYGNTSNAMFTKTGRDNRTIPDYQNHGKRETY